MQYIFTHLIYLASLGQAKSFNLRIETLQRNDKVLQTLAECVVERVGGERVLHSGHGKSVAQRVGEN